jgi:hypothetical protein
MFSIAAHRGVGGYVEHDAKRVCQTSSTYNADEQPGSRSLSPDEQHQAGTAKCANAFEEIGCRNRRFHAAV